MTLAFLNELIEEKMRENENYLVFTFYEFRVKNNLSQEDTQAAIELAKQKLNNNGYKTYCAKDPYILNGEVMSVTENQLLVAIKE